MTDCYSREILGHCVGYHFTDKDVGKTITIPFNLIDSDNISRIGIRSNYRTQFLCIIVEKCPSMMNTSHERIHHDPPKKYVDIESFNSIWEDW